ncbi:MAG: hypothetical protein ACI9K3_000805, partial [Halovenus sp.]
RGFCDRVNFGSLHQEFRVCLRANNQFRERSSTPPGETTLSVCVKSGSHF